MGKPNYAFEKRQRELAKKKKKEEKRQKKLGQGAGESEAGQPPLADAQDAPIDKGI
jgi:hypothetical protein